jgi:hypothetical protein
MERTISIPSGSEEHLLFVACPETVEDIHRLSSNWRKDRREGGIVLMGEYTGLQYISLTSVDFAPGVHL